MHQAGSSPDDLVLDSYRLSREYKQTPETFLEMPLSTIAVHRRRTAQLMELMAKEREQDDA